MGEFLQDPVNFLMQRPVLMWQVVVGGGCAMMAYLFGQWIITPRPKRDLLPRNRSTVTLQTMQPQKKTTERRSFFRRAGRPVGVDVLSADEMLQIGTGTVVDRSFGGVGLLFNAPMEIGAEIHLRPHNLNKGLPSLVLQVRSCRLSPTKGQYHIGCQYIERPSWNVAMHLG